MQYAVFLHVRHDRRAGLGIEIARQDHRPIPAQRFDALPEQVHAFVAGDLPYMVEVGVDEEELPAPFPVMQYDPGCHALAGAVPPFRACDVGGFAQPESPGFEGRKTIPPVKYGTELARLGTVLTADAHRSIAGQQTLQVAELVGKQAPACRKRRRRAKRSPRRPARGGNASCPPRLRGCRNAC